MTDIVPASGGGEMAVPADMLAEMQQMAAEAVSVVDSTDLRLSQFALVQGLSRAVQEQGAVPGRIINDLTGEMFDKIEFAVSFIKKTRTRFEKGNVGGPPLCASPDALNGYGDPGDQLEARGNKGGGDCTRCPHAVVNFQTREIGDCALQYNFIGHQIVEGKLNPMPMVIQMQRTSIRTAQSIATILAGQQFPWSIRLALSPKAQRNDSGSFYVWQVGKGEALPAEDQIRCFETAKLVRDAQTFEVSQTNASDGNDGGAPRSAAGAAAASARADVDSEDIPF